MEISRRRSLTIKAGEQLVEIREVNQSKRLAGEFVSSFFLFPDFMFHTCYGHVALASVRERDHKIRRGSLALCLVHLHDAVLCIKFFYMHHTYTSYIYAYCMRLIYTYFFVSAQ